LKHQTQQPVSPTAAVAQKNPGIPLPIAAPRNSRVLVMDDNRSIHDDFRKILSPATAASAAMDATEVSLFGPASTVTSDTRFEVESAYQGQEGAAIVQEALAAGRPYALAFIDVRMPPGWDGVETAQRIQEIDPEIQIVICTAYSDYSWAEMFQKLPHRDGLLILKKPFDAVEALQLAHALTEKWWLRQQAQRKLEDLERLVVERTGRLQEINDSLELKIVEHEHAERMLRESDQKFRQLAENITDVFWMANPGTQAVLYASPAYEEVWGRSLKSLHANSHDWLDAIHPEDRDRVAGIFAKLESGEPRVSAEYRILRPDGSIRWISDRGFVVRNEQHRSYRTVGIASDITERKRLETQLFESQKLETVGRLAGGVAHEFNSIMTAIIGQSELLLTDLPEGNPLSKNAIEIRKAGERAATLTRQLLAYGRKQRLQPEVLNLNSALVGMESTLRHLLGRDTNVRFALAIELRPVLADAGQIEQVIMNIAMNAADAMPGRGLFTIETENVSFDAESVVRYPELKPGDYAMLAIADTGAGMSADVLSRIFDPFFTTKGVGQGAGLGLSTCYGIIKQSSGHIAVYSEPGRGTTFKIYLPQVELPPQVALPRLASPGLPQGTETILLVEDDPALREMVASLLRRLGYTVLAAENGIEALSFKQNPATGPVDLLLTGVVMPHMNGKELADRVRALYPHTKILFTSAYTQGAIVHQGVLDEGVTMLQKPFTPSALARKLRDLLGQPASAGT
jgi:two-component system cell cycle sensor histidine kinase/response regulator CckA